MARSQQRIHNLYGQLYEQLNSEIIRFVDSHYEDERAGEKWQRCFQNLKFDEKYQELLKSLADECERKRKDLSDELTQELRYTLNNNTQTNIRMGGTTPWGKYAALVLPNLLMFIPGIGWGARIAIGIGSALFSFLFEDKQEKIREAKSKLSNAITPPSRDILNQMHDKVIETFNNEILAKGVDEFSDLLAGYQFMLARLGQSQSVMARLLFDEFSDLNFKLLVEANNYKGVGAADVSDIPRIPGEKMLILADNSNLDTRKLSDLLGENVSVMKPEELPDTVKKILGSDFDVDNYPLDFSKENEDVEKAIALLTKNKVDATSFKLAQQIAGVTIIAEFTQTQKVTQPLHNVSSRPQKNPSGNAFKSDFAKIDEMLERPRKSNEGIKKALKKLEAKVSNQRNAEAMNKIAIYYGRIHAHDDCDRCFELAEMYARR